MQLETHRPGSSWLLVRHVPQGLRWHNATDQLRGVDVYGDPGLGLGTEFSVSYHTEEYNQVSNRQNKIKYVVLRNTLLFTNIFLFVMVIDRSKAMHF